MIELSEYVAQVRQQIYGSMLAAADEPMRLDIEEVVLEINVVLSSEVSGNGALKLWVLGEAGAGATTGSFKSQQMRITLKPRFVEGHSTPWVAGRELRNEH